MLEEIIAYISTLDTSWIYVILFFFAFIENVFPPSPSDVVVVVGASLIATTSLGFVPVLIITSIGSALGFILMYYVGYFLSEKVLRSGKLKFISQDALHKTDEWFTKYGYKIILANRFLPGTRSVISFFSGVHELHVVKTFIFSLLSAFAWNLIIVYLGMTLGNNIPLIDYYLKTYSNIGMALTALIVIGFGIRYFIKKKKNA
ncbi:MAG: DedA family protein [Ignavibacteriae bacterium]|nr:DedA family protein [Ignavibacteriota bacterium]MCB9210212.1 DedA family protein [Ignavibacteriales bacterium]MCB9259592.1 DedA family protein [Ignavibacteriales bacterium]